MTQLTTKTAQRLKDIYNGGLPEQRDEIISFKNELKEIIDRGNNTHEIFKEVTFFCRRLILEIESIENQKDFLTSNIVGSEGK